MLCEKMYVRCPADIDSATDPRIFVCGQITGVDDFKQTATVQIHDPFGYLAFFEDLPRGTIEFPLDQLEHCKLFVGSQVMYKGKTCKVIAVRRTTDDYYFYYLQDTKDRSIYKTSERYIAASFTNGQIDPASQLEKYELQNPCWYLGRAVVSRSMNVLENSIYGFKELAGSKIYLLPHQVNTIMRCLQQTPCRYMLADEVGMGKTVEAISVLKIYMQSRSKQNILIVVPDTLKEQWKAELLLKFNITVGSDFNQNRICLKAASEANEQLTGISWDFVVVDEVHRYLTDSDKYSLLHQISRNAKNILLLSATPVQQRREEYLDLLRLLQPQKYDSFSLEQFSSLVDKQRKIIQRSALILDDLGDLEEEIGNAEDAEENPHDSEDCRDLFDEIYEELEDICEELNDEKLSGLLEEVSFESDDLGVYCIKVILSFICSNYQVESNIIRNRRKLLEESEDGERLLPVRELSTVTYTLDKDRNTYEAICYELLSDWIAENASELDVEQTIAPLLGAFFSSPWAFKAVVDKMGRRKYHRVPHSLITNAENWLETEKHILQNISSVLDDPDTYENYYNSRLVSVVNLVFDELYDKKIVLFTNYKESFQVYREALSKVFPAEEVSFFGDDMSADDIELNAYRFQNEPTCRMILCDYTGGEGRNFQCADYIIHIDLPWDANMIEQRIGRLDRLERDPSRSVVTSVVIHTEETFEEALFKFWSEGLKIFNQSLSGMEIIMKDINRSIVDAVQKDFKYGLFEQIPVIIQKADVMRENVKREQNYDTAGLMFQPMYTELKRLVDYYARNENELFARTMTSWASLAGFHGFGDGYGITKYTAASFSPKSAINSQLIPPRWNEYLSLEQNKFVNDVQNAYNRQHAIKPQNQAIRGTFTRKFAIENDYLHFFAPGDAVFDCIVDNAINSCKGTASAFAVRSGINWKGLVFTWSISPNQVYLMDHGVSIYALGPYRSYLMTEQISTIFSLENPDESEDEQIVREYNQIINMGFVKSKSVHLGKRSHEPKFLKEVLPEEPNIAWFRGEYPEETWAETVEAAKKEAYQKALEQFRRRSNIRGVKEEMERVRSAKAANGEFYGISDDDAASLKDEQQIILDSIRKSQITLDSAAFVWMVKTDDDTRENQ